MRKISFVGLVAGVATPGRKLGFEGFGDAGVDVLKLHGVEVNSGGVFAEFVGFLDEVIFGDNKGVAAVEGNFVVDDGISAMLEAEIEVSKVYCRVLIVAIFVFGSRSEFNRLFEVAIDSKDAAGKSVGVAGSVNFGKWRIERDGAGILDWSVGFADDKFVVGKVTAEAESGKAEKHSQNNWEWIGFGLWRWWRSGLSVFVVGAWLEASGARLILWVWLIVIVWLHSGYS